MIDIAVTTNCAGVVDFTKVQGDDINLVIKAVQKLQEELLFGEGVSDEEGELPGSVLCPTCGLVYCKWEKGGGNVSG